MRLQGGTTIFAEMSALAARTGSINLGQGFPDTDGPAELLEAAVAAIRSGRHNQYPPGLGIPQLRQAIAAHQSRFYRQVLDPDTDVLVTAGATEAIAAAVLALTEPGDEVAMFEPYYDSYAATVQLAGCSRRVVTLRPQPGTPTHWSFDVEELRAVITDRTRLILLNTPHNPTGAVFTDAELSAIADIAKSNDTIVISDEVYEHLVFRGKHRPIATLPGMAQRTVTISSAGKTFSVTGWKIGWAVGPAHLINAVRGVKQFLTYVSGGPFQPAVAAALGSDDDFYRVAAQSLADRRDRFCTGLAGYFRVLVPEATYFATVDVGSDAADFCRQLPERAGVVAIPSSAFYDSSAGDTFVRFAFCKRPEVLDGAVARLRELSDPQAAGAGNDEQAAGAGNEEQAARAGNDHEPAMTTRRRGAAEL